MAADGAGGVALILFADNDSAPAAPSLPPARTVIPPPELPVTGAWRVHEDDDYSPATDVVDANDRIVASCFGDDVASAGYNAMLVAAAPDLREAAVAALGLLCAIRNGRAATIQELDEATSLLAVAVGRTVLL